MKSAKVAMVKSGKMLTLPDYEITMVDLASLPSQFIGYQIFKTNIPDVWLESEGEGIKVAVLDTGVDMKHKDLSESVPLVRNFTQRSKVQYHYRRYKKERTRYRKLARRQRAGDCGSDCRRQKKSSYSKLKKERTLYRYYNNDVTDKDGHGTHVTGIVTANNNTFGIVGVAPKAEIMVIKVLGDDGTGSLTDVRKGINWALDYGADVISMSLGTTSYTRAFHNCIKKAYRKNVPIICASGNSGAVGRLVYPAQYPETISVGAVDERNIRAWFSQGGSNLDFVAPGVDIVSCAPGNKYVTMSGTSMATPWVAGVVALIMAKHKKSGGATPVDTVEQVRDHLKKASIDIGELGKDAKTGYGIIDVKKAVENHGVSETLEKFKLL